MKKLLVLCITGILLLGAGGAEALAEEGETSSTEAAQAASEDAADVVNSALEAWHSNALRGYTWAYVSADGQEKETWIYTIEDESETVKSWERDDGGELTERDFSEYYSSDYTWYDAESGRFTDCESVSVSDKGFQQYGFQSSMNLESGCGTVTENAEASDGKKCTAYRTEMDFVFTSEMDGGDIDDTATGSISYLVDPDTGMIHEIYAERTDEDGTATVTITFTVGEDCQPIE